MDLRCMNCFKVKRRVRGKVVCFDCACELYPNQTFEDPSPPFESEGDAKKHGSEISARLTRAKNGLRLTDFPIHLQEQVKYRHIKRSLAKVGDRYYLNSQAKLLKQQVEV